MGTKSNPGNIDCYAAALPDEHVFVLLGRDPALPATVRFWVGERTRLGKNVTDDDAMKLAEASQVANAAEAWRDKIVKWAEENGFALPWHLARPAKALGEDRPIRIDPTRPGNRALDAASFMLDALDHPLVRKTLAEIIGRGPSEAATVEALESALLDLADVNQLRAKIVVGLNQITNDLQPFLERHFPDDDATMSFVDRINGYAAELGDGLPVDMLSALQQPDPARGADTSHATVADIGDTPLAHDLLDDGDREPPLDLGQFPCPDGQDCTGLGRQQQP